MSYHAFGGPAGNTLPTDAVPESLKRRAVWNKGRLRPGFDPTIWRYDDFGNPIKFDEYGNRSSPYGWEYDHHPVPKALGGSDHESNLRPLRCATNLMLGGLLGNTLRRL
jgi:hypothetical protein